MSQFKLNRLSTISIFFLFMIVMVACSEKREKVIATQRHTFEHADWNFDEKFIFFDFDLQESPDSHRIDMEIAHTPNLDFKTLSFVVTITAPSGAQTQRKISANSGVRNQDGTITTIVPYPQKFFNESGIYNFKIYRRYDKYNFFGISSLALKIVRLFPED